MPPKSKADTPTSSPKKSPPRHGQCHPRYQYNRYSKEKYFWMNLNQSQYTPKWINLNQSQYTPKFILFPRTLVEFIYRKSKHLKKITTTHTTTISNDNSGNI